MIKILKRESIFSTASLQGSVGRKFKAGSGWDIGFAADDSGRFFCA
ncbi:MAG: hypothetical protein K2N85_10850 [Lachnospiraceae bacterium]|nr:hypothetical protein [Lachnospiraceae bacterium]